MQLHTPSILTTYITLAGGRMVIKFLLGQGIYVTKPLLFFQKGSGTRLASKPLIALTLFDHAHSFRFELHNIFNFVYFYVKLCEGSL